MGRHRDIAREKRRKTKAEREFAQQAEFERWIHGMPEDDGEYRVWLLNQDRDMRPILRRIRKAMTEQGKTLDEVLDSPA